MARLLHSCILVACLVAVASAAGPRWSTRRLLIEGGQTVEQNGQRFYVNPSQVNVSGCTDVAPDDRYSCDQQKSFGQCNAPFMVESFYCNRTCLRCGFALNPSQANATTCTDVPPDARFTCAQQREFGKCARPYMIEGNYCAQSCGRAPCPPVGPVPIAAANETIVANQTLAPVTPGAVLPAAGVGVTTPPIGAAVSGPAALPATGPAAVGPAALPATGPAIVPEPVPIANITAPIAGNETALPAVTGPNVVAAPAPPSAVTTTPLEAPVAPTPAALTPTTNATTAAAPLPGEAVATPATESNVTAPAATLPGAAAAPANVTAPATLAGATPELPPAVNVTIPASNVTVIAPAGALPGVENATAAAVNATG